MDPKLQEAKIIVKSKAFIMRQVCSHLLAASVQIHVYKNDDKRGYEESLVDFRFLKKKK